MVLAININYLLNKQKIESNRIEFKKGWNSGNIYHSICAFANDFDNLGGASSVTSHESSEKKLQISSEKKRKSSERTHD